MREKEEEQRYEDETREIVRRVVREETPKLGKELAKFLNQRRIK